MNIISVLKNKVLIYLVSRYAIYAIQFLTALIIAAQLGPYYMGIWGFFLLLVQYFQRFNFGIANSFNVLYVQHRDNQRLCENYIGNSLALLSVLGVFVIVIYTIYIIYGGSLFAKYHIDKYMLWVCVIAILQYYAEFLITLFRVKNKLYSVAFCQSIIVIFSFVSVVFFRGEELIKWLIVSYVIGNSLCIILGFVTRVIPGIGKVKYSLVWQKDILKKGLYLFLYNSCFYYIMITIRTIISDYYSVEDFGLFSFSYTLAYAIFFIIGALGFVVFPKVIGKLSSNDNKEVIDTITLLRRIYVTSTHFLVYSSIAVFPVLLRFMTQYDGCSTSFNLIALTILITTCSYGYLELLISKNKEKLLSLLSASALGINYILGIMIVKSFRVSFSFVIIATLITYILYTFTILCIGKTNLNSLDWRTVLWDFFPLRLLMPYVAALIVTFSMTNVYIWVPVALFILLNWKEGRELVKTVRLIMARPEVVDL